jgi:hypothetical protein
MGGPHNSRAEGLTNRLMSQANTEDGDFAAELLDYF